jgi:hypothetical protein
VRSSAETCPEKFKVVWRNWISKLWLCRIRTSQASSGLADAGSECLHRDAVSVLVCGSVAQMDAWVAGQRGVRPQVALAGMYVLAAGAVYVNAGGREVAGAREVVQSLRVPEPVRQRDEAGARAWLHQRGQVFVLVRLSLFERKNLLLYGFGIREGGVV